MRFTATRPGRPASRAIDRAAGTVYEEVGALEPELETEPGLDGLRVAVIDRDPAFVAQLRTHAHEVGWRLTVHPAALTVSALERVGARAVLVDIGFLGPRWDDWLARHPARLHEMGLLVVTERSTIKQRVRGLCAGADDWIAKPCAIEELAARVQGVVRAHSVSARLRSTRPLCSVGLEVRPDLYDALVDGRPARLTRREFDVLHCLARGGGEVLSRERVYREVWGGSISSRERALDTAVRKIRAKLERLAPERSYVHTHWGVGYRFGYERARPRG
jgi:DNA-binding response OmpR family regulator